MNLDSYILIFSAASMMSLSHCPGMCGGIALYLNMNSPNSKPSKIIQILANISYFLGRALGYITIGVIFFVISGGFKWSPEANGWVLIALGIALFTMSFIITFYPKLYPKGIGASEGYLNLYKKLFKAIMAKGGLIRNLILGVFNAFLPCHLVYTFAIKAADSKSLLEAIFSMMAFAWGTFLPLFLFGMLSVSMINSRYRNIAMKISFLIMIYFAISNIYEGINIINAPNQDHSHHHH